MMGMLPSSRTNSRGSPSLILYSKVAVSLPRYVEWRSLHSAGYISLFLANLLLGGSTDFCSDTLLYLMVSLFGAPADEPSGLSK